MIQRAYKGERLTKEYNCKSIDPVIPIFLKKHYLMHIDIHAKYDGIPVKIKKQKPKCYKGLTKGKGLQRCITVKALTL